MSSSTLETGWRLHCVRVYGEGTHLQRLRLLYWAEEDSTRSEHGLLEDRLWGRVPVLAVLILLYTRPLFLPPFPPFHSSTSSNAPLALLDLYPVLRGDGFGENMWEWFAMLVRVIKTNCSIAM